MGVFHFSKKYITFSVLLIIVCTTSIWFFYQVLNNKPADNWVETKAVNSQAVQLPQDDAPHNAGMEWWYYNGHLKTDSGKQYSFHYTVFLLNNLMSHMVLHVSLSDHQTGKHYTAQRRTGGNTSIGTKNRFEFMQRDWIMEGGNGDDRLNIIMDDFAFDINLSETRAPVLHGEKGIISLDVAGSSYYYSRTRMAVSGTITIGDISEKAAGIAWFDHQWGDFSVGLLSWDWFSLMLSDDIDLMIYQLRDKANKPVLYVGSITQNNSTELIDDTEFTITPGKKWTSSKTNIAYPIEWTIKIPQRNINITINSLVRSNEFDARLTSHNIYWEGAIKAQGSHTGRGFMELYGYTDREH